MGKKKGYTRVKTEPAYNHYWFEEERVCLIGVNKDISEDAARLYIDAPIISASNKFWKEFVQLSQTNRQIIQKAMDKWHQKTQKKTILFNNYNWNVFTDFLFSRYDLSLYDIAREIEGTGTISKNRRKKSTYDNLNNLLKIKTQPRKENIILAKEICAYYLVTYDLITTGQGYIYSLDKKYDPMDFNEQLSNYTFENIQKEFNEADGNEIDTKQLLLKLTGLKEEDISCIPIQIFGSKPMLDQKAEQVFITIMNEMK